MLTNHGLVEYAKAWLGYTTRYGWGCWGQPISASIIQQKARQYPSHYSASRQAELLRLDGYLIDCVGLIKGYYWGQQPRDKVVKYIASTDVSADGMLARAEVKGPIGTMPDLPGICVHLKDHIGVYVGSGMVVEATRGVFGDGVVKTNLMDRRWTSWLECPYITYQKEENSMAEEWKRSIMSDGIAAGVLTEYHEPDEPATKWFVVALALNVLKILRGVK